MMRSPRLRFLSILIYGLAGAQGAHAAGPNGGPEDTGTVYSLSREEKAQIEAEAYERRMRGAGLADEEEGRRFHGEASIMVGTGGARGLATSMVAPVGKGGTVGASFVYERNGYDPYHAYDFYDRYGPYGPYGPYGHARASFGASDHFGHLRRVERIERFRDWQAGRP